MEEKKKKKKKSNTEKTFANRNVAHDHVTNGHGTSEEEQGKGKN